SKIKTCSELKNIFYSNNCANIYVPDHKRIIIIEDIDCLTDLVIDREFQYKNEKNNNELIDKLFDSELEVKYKENNKATDQNVKIEDKLTSYLNDYKKSDDKLNLGFILN